MSPLPMAEKSNPVPPPVLPHFTHYQTIPIYPEQPLRRIRRASPLRILLGAAIIVAVFYSLRPAMHYAKHLVHSFRGDGDFEDREHHTHIPDGLVVDHCAEWNDQHSRLHEYEHSSYTSFELPASSDTLFLLSHGSSAGGSLTLSNATAPGAAVQVEVIVHYNEPHRLEAIKVCQVSREESQDGVGIFTPNRWDHPHEHDRYLLPYFNVTVKFPALSGDSILHIKNFETKLVLFSQTVEDLNHKVNFQGISLATANKAVHADHLVAEKIAVYSANAPITGYYNSSSSLTLTTANARINVTVGLQNSDEQTATELSLKTANAPIDAAINLASTGSTGGGFRVDAHTAAGGINLAFPEAPVDSFLELKAQTAVADVVVALHPTYEGSFNLATSLGRVFVEQGEVEDPAERGRRRVVSTRSVRGSTAEGDVKWVPVADGSRPGSVTLHTAVGSAILKV